MNKLPASLPVFSRAKAAYREKYRNGLWPRARNQRACFPLSGEESSKPLGHLVEITVRTGKPFLELKDQAESKKQEEKELLNRVYLRRDGGGK